MFTHYLKGLTGVLGSIRGVTTIQFSTKMRANTRRDKYSIFFFWFRVADIEPIAALTRPDVGEPPENRL